MTDRNHFYIVLPSNSSMKFFPENTTTHFTTQLSTPLRLDGEWEVSLSEIHIPMTFLHVPLDDENNYVSLTSTPIVENGKNGEYTYVDRSGIEPGIYKSVDDIINLINSLPFMKKHVELKTTNGGFVYGGTICENCPDVPHNLQLSPALKKILGYRATTEDIPLMPASYKDGHLHSAESLLGVHTTTTATEHIRYPPEPSSYRGDHPVSLTASIPSSIYVYSDICESYVTGDVQTPLLRVVPLELDHYYSYGCVKIKNFSSPRFIPLLRREFQTIEIDIRDEFGQPVPFDRGTLTVTLQFKRVG